MKVAVNTRHLIDGKIDGIGKYILAVIKPLVLNHPEIDFLFLFDRPFNTEYLFAPNVKGEIISPKARHPFIFIYWFEFGVKKTLKKHNVDVFLSIDGFLSLGSKIPQISVIHDLNFEHYPQHLPFFYRHYYKIFFPLFARKSHHIITVSHFSKQDIIDKYKIKNDDITVAYSYVNDSFTKSNLDSINNIKSIFSDDKDYFLFVSSIHPRKNLKNILKSFDKFKSIKSNDVKLIVVGKKFYWPKDNQEIFDRMKFKKDVVFTSYITENDVIDLYSGAIAMLYPSFFEGFGLPILEANICECPVITSNISSMPEIAGDSSLLVNPYDVNEISEAMTQLYYNEDNIRENLIQKSKENIKKFSPFISSELIYNALLNSIKKD